MEFISVDNSNRMSRKYETDINDSLAKVEKQYEVIAKKENKTVFDLMKEREEEFRKIENKSNLFDEFFLIFTFYRKHNYNADMKRFYEEYYIKYKD